MDDSEQLRLDPADDWRSRLRAVPAFPDRLPLLVAAEAPSDPRELFHRWLAEAIATGARQVNAATLATVRGDGYPGARTLILKDITADGYCFASHRDSAKGQELERAPRASLLFFWREQGRQVRLTGEVHLAGKDACRADWEARPTADGTPAPPTWQVYLLVPREYEFLQARQDRHHTRLGYQRTASGWHHAPVTTPAG